MRYCENCGAPVEEGVEFCGECGEKISKAYEDKKPDKNIKIPEKFGVKKPIVAVIAIIIVAGIAGGLIFFNSRKNNANTSSMTLAETSSENISNNENETTIKQPAIQNNNTANTTAENTNNSSSSGTGNDEKGLEVPETAEVTETSEKNINIESADTKKMDSEESSSAAAFNSESKEEETVNASNDTSSLSNQDYHYDPYLWDWSDTSEMRDNDYESAIQMAQERGIELPAGKTFAQMLINEIYARHGYIFSSKELQEYFQNKSWYTPKTNNMDQISKELNGAEKSNIDYLNSLQGKGAESIPEGILYDKDEEYGYSGYYEDNLNGISLSLSFYTDDEGGNECASFDFYSPEGSHSGVLRRISPNLYKAIEYDYYSATMYIGAYFDMIARRPAIDIWRDGVSYSLFMTEEYES